ncbi:hypothetical protein QFC20_002214 [Naganishia adeliensis]|uniref:Uncharacterized protein n=1 Tax=Naganishia adeliensis TaxID=92952 RepID=A0ACC2WMW1_9TREE|nr:hypothetical protein QFC20_002214 [Naganishia adeliensis]
MNVYGLEFWKRENDKTHSPGEYGFTARQLGCLEEIEDMIGAFGEDVEPQEHQRLRNTVCRFMATALAGLRSEYGIDAYSNYKHKYKQIASELRAEKVTELHTLWEETLESLTCSHQATIDEMMAPIDGRSVETTATDAAIPLSPALSGYSSDREWVKLSGKQRNSLSKNL